MIKKFAVFLIFIFVVLVLITAMDQQFINDVKQNKYFAHLEPENGKHSFLYRQLFLQTDRWRYGDLYGLCYLHYFKQQLGAFRKYDQVIAHPATSRRLYIIGDSYLADKVLNSAFTDFDEVTYLDRRFFTEPIKLDSTKQNYLLMEFAERNLAGYDLFKTSEVKWKKAEIATKATTTDSKHTDTERSKSIFGRFGDIVFNKNLSTNIELILFDHKLFTRLKELKAAFNYRILDRIFPKEVSISTDRKRLFLTMTVDPDYLESSFRSISNRELYNINGRLDTAQNYYQSIGFKEVFLSVIPNTASVCDTRRMNYNHLLEKVEKTTDLPVISVLNAFKNSKTNVFFNSDAHWNPVGFDIWVNKVNSEFKTFFSQNSPNFRYIGSN